MPRYVYHFRRDDGTPLRWFEPGSSFVVEGGSRSAIATAKRWAAETGEHYTVFATRASRPYMGDGESFDSPNAVRIGRYGPNS